MAGGNHEAASLMAQAFGDSSPRMIGGGSSGGSDVMEEQYKTMLKQWLADNERSYVEADSARLKEYAGSLESQLANPKLNQSQKDTYLQAMGIMGGNWQTEQGLSAAAHAAGQLLNFTGQAGTPTNEMKNYQAIQDDPQMKEFLDWKNRTAAQKIADVLNDPSVPEDQKEVLRQSSKIHKDIPHERSVAEQQTFGREEAQAVTKMYNDMPRTFAAYDAANQMVGEIHQGVQEALTFLNQNPGAAGYNSLLSSIPETQANALRARLDKVKSNIALETLKELKDHSPTGASGFGALSEGELRVITDRLGKLDQSMTADELQKVLMDIDQSILRVNQNQQKWLQSSRGFYEGNANTNPILWDAFKNRFDQIPQAVQPAPGDLTPQGVVTQPAPSVGDNFQNNLRSVQGQPSSGSGLQDRINAIRQNRQR